MHYPLNGDLGRSQAIPEKDIEPPELEIKRLSVDNSRRLVRSRLRQFAGENDVCARLGGNEFVLLVNTNTSQINELAASIVDILAQPFHLNESSTATIGVSIGIMLIGEDASVDAIPALMRLADEALYAAKSAGRGTFRYGSDLATEISTVPDAA